MEKVLTGAAAAAHEKKAGGAVITKRAGGQVRLRNHKGRLPVSVTPEGKQTIRATLINNQWVTVPPEIYELLKHKFSVERTRLVPDAEANERNPHAYGEEPAMREEEVDTYIIEFRD